MICLPSTYWCSDALNAVNRDNIIQNKSNNKKTILVKNAIDINNIISPEEAKKVVSQFLLKMNNAEVDEAKKIFSKILIKDLFSPVSNDDFLENLSFEAEPNSFEPDQPTLFDTIDDYHNPFI